MEPSSVLVSHVEYSNMRACSLRYSAVRVYSQKRYSTLKEVVSLFMKSTHHLRRNSKPLKMSDSVFVKSVRIATVVTLYW